MKKKEKKLKLKVNVIVQLKTKAGEIIETAKAHNLIVNTGKYNVGDYLGGLATGLVGFPYIGIGQSSSGDVVAVGDTNLIDEVTRDIATINRTANEVTFEKTFSFATAEAYAIEEAGLFDSALETGSIMFNRALFTTKNVDFDTDLYIKITITIG